MKLLKIIFTGCSTVDEFIDSTFLLPDFIISVLKGFHVLQNQSYLKAIRERLQMNQCAVKNNHEISIRDKIDNIGRYMIVFHLF